ncbi:MAG: FG-GAP-like repeat-containing protein [Myxococcota bacterium]
MKRTGLLMLAGFVFACGAPSSPSPGNPDLGPTVMTDAGPLDCSSLGDGAACDDGDPCTMDDACAGGRCVGAVLECPDDLDGCRVGTCVDGACTLATAPDETPCDDGDLCTRTDVCMAGVCAGRDALNCDGSATCVVGSCDPATGECVGEPEADGTPCDNACVFNGSCRDGACVGVPNTCPAGASCEELRGCDPVVGCVYDVAEDGTRCDDDSLCTLSDRCEAGECVGDIFSCPQPPTCFEAFCDPEVGCVEQALPDGTACEDEDLCTVMTECSTGVCQSLVDVECALLPCMQGNECNPGTGACEPEYLVQGTFCDDGNLCTAGEFCDNNDCRNGVKAPFSEPRCDDGVCFTDVTVQAGISFGNNGGRPKHNHASVAAIGDLDGDDDLDLLLVSEIEGPKFYRNDGNGHFTDRTAFADFTAVNTSTATVQGLAMGDYDNDGDLDLYFSSDGPNFLLRNDGSARFTNVTAAAGVDYSVWTAGASFGDYDGDGWLDLYVGGYIFGPGSRYPNHIGRNNRLFHNEGDGTFTEVAANLGIGGHGTTAGTTLVTAITDFDGDGDMDLMDCNDFGQTVVPNRVYENDGSGNFTEVSAQKGLNATLFCMGIAIGDYDRDGDLDYYHTSIGRHELLENRGAAGFVDVAGPRGVKLQQDDCVPRLKAAGWGTFFEDFDNDGWPDLFVANGYIVAARAIDNALESENKLLLNQEGVTPGAAFLDASRSARIATDDLSRGAVAADFDRDGDVDLLVANMETGVELLRNDLANSHGWLIVALDGRVSNRDGVGAKVTVETIDGSQLREMGSTPSYLSPCTPEAHFGLGSQPEADIRVEWPSGLEQRWVEVDEGALVRIVESRISLDGYTAPTTAPPGQDMAVTVDFTEQAGIATSARVTVDLQQADGTVVAHLEQTLALLASASGRASFSVSIPAGASGPMRLFIEVEDFGAFDQWIHPFTVSP